MGTAEALLERPLATQYDLSLALERAGAAYGAYELSARRTRFIWRAFRYLAPLIIVATIVGYLLYFQQVQRNDALEHRLTMLSVQQEPVVPAIDILAAKIQELQPPTVVVVPAVAGDPTPATPSASTEAQATPPPAPVEAVTPTLQPEMATGAKAQAVTETPGAGCLLNLICLQNLLGG